MEEILQKLIQSMQGGKWYWLAGIVALWVFTNRASIGPLWEKLKPYLPKKLTVTPGEVSKQSLTEKRMAAVAAYYVLRDALKECGQKDGIKAMDQVAVCLSHIGESHAESN